jgi:hypothetical protein
MYRVAVRSARVKRLSGRSESCSGANQATSLSSSLSARDTADDLGFIADGDIGGPVAVWVRDLIVRAAETPPARVILPRSLTLFS